MAPHLSSIGSMQGRDADEQLARRLQAEFDAAEGAALAQDLSGFSIGSQHQYPSAYQPSPAPRTQVNQYSQQYANRPQHLGPPDDASITQFVRTMQGTVCSLCKVPLITDMTAIGVMFDTIYASCGRETCIVHCRRCNHLTCMSCLNAVSPGKVCACGGTNGNPFMIWTLLCGADYILTTEAEAAQMRQVRSTPRKSTVKGQGTGYGSATREERKAFPGFGFESIWGGHRGRRNRDTAQQATGERQRDEAQKDSDLQMSKIMGMLTTWLPQLRWQSKFNQTPDKVLSALLLRSSILDKAAELLRNDSIDDIQKRAVLYSKCVGFVNTLAYHPGTAPTVVNERIARENSLNLLQFSFPTGQSKEGARTITRASVASVAENIITQCSVLLRKQPKDNSTLYEILCAFYGLDKAFQSNSSSQTSGKKKVYEQLYRVAEVPDNLLLQDFVYAREAQRSAHGTNPRRQTTLMKEIASMTTSLPDGIFVRYASSRMDLMKCIIIGPQDTPYENGIFEFDMMCPPSYPNEPPKVNCRGARHSREELNPNLHGDGVVCLSLLGTWPGESWQPGKSTLLQVLLSIQSMILCEEPFYNEPGNERIGKETGHGKILSDALNRHFRIAVINSAVLPWLSHQALMHPVWYDVIQRHWHANAARVLQTTAKWCREEQDAVEWQRRGGKLPALSGVPPSVRILYAPPQAYLHRLYPALEKALWSYMPH